MTTASSSPSHYSAGGEHRQRCHTNGNGNGNSSSSCALEVPSAVAAAAAAAAIRTMAAATAADDDDLDIADQKYDKRAKARIVLKRKRRKQQYTQQYGGAFWSSSSGKPPSVAQMVGLLLLFTALLSTWHYMRTVWWTHGQAARRYHATEDESKMTLYERAAARIKEHHLLYSKPLVKHAALEQRGSYRERHERQERKRLQRQQQQQQHQQRDDGITAAASNSRRQRDDGPPARGKTPPPQQQDDQKQEQEEEDEEMDMAELETLSTNRLQQLFLEQRLLGNNNNNNKNSFFNVEKILVAWLNQLNRDILTNVHGGIRWIRPYLLPPLPGLSKPDDDEQQQEQQRKRRGGGGGPRGGGGGRFHFGGAGELSSQQLQRQFFRVDRMTTKTATKTTLDGASSSSSSSSSQFKWEDEWNDLIQQQGTKIDSVGKIHIDLKKDGADEATEMVARKLISQPVVDYTSKQKYRYPPLRKEPPPPERFSEYPQLTSLASMMDHWDQDEDFHGTITETLLHFNYSDPNELEMARKFRDAELPFKLTNVPELDAANLKWTDDYVSKQFDRATAPRGYLKRFFQSKTAAADHDEKNDPDLQAKPATGLAQESPNHYFAFFTPPQWNVETMGLPPVRNNDWTYAKWAEHARYADAVRLSPDQPHFYWQSGVDKEERHGPKGDWTFISRDLPSWSSPKATFMVFDPKAQKGIQCRFGERGVVAATHYDSGRNMVGMITGAKRYILSPPRACSKLGIFTHQRSPIFRHSLLNFGHLKYLKGNDGAKRSSDHEESRMSKEERAWLERASQAQAVETVLKAGEVLYIPSFWFHYIVSLQKSAQCNVRSGVGHDGSGEFGGPEDVRQCVD